MFLTQDNKIKWKWLGLAAGLVAALCLLGVLWLDRPLYLFLREFDWSGWKILGKITDDKVWLAVSAAAFVIFGIIHGKNSEKSKTREPFFANLFNLLKKNAKNTVQTISSVKNFTSWFNGLRDAKNGIARAQFASALVFVGVLAAMIAAWVSKGLLGRMRPVFFESLGQTGFYPFNFSEWAFNSMPSGHAAASFAGFVMLGMLFPKIKWATWTAAIAVGLSRICYGAHFPSDVLLGAFIGMAAADLVKAAAYKIKGERK